jgi:DNA-binding NtrC family response regulator
VDVAKKQGKILVIDDNEDILLAARLLLSQHVATIHAENNPENIPSLLRNNDYDAIMLDMNFTRDVSSGHEGFQWLGRILEIDPSAVVVLITAYGDVDTAVRAIKEGAADFVLKPWHNEKLWATVSAAMNLRRTRIEANGLRQRQRQLSADLDQPFSEFIGVCPAMLQVFSVIAKVAATDASVLILGENGTGKELVAREIHRQSRRASDVFISVDVGAITESLFESELFGHVRGAFTDAREDRAGRLEVAGGGTLFLDEIGNLPLSLQTKLLSVLESRQVIRVGSNTPRPIDVRLISATNLPIHKRASSGEFRQDLLYRINTVEIHLPPLRERQADIPSLIEHFLERFRKKYNKSAMLVNPAALRMLQRYSWPGNVRELQHAVERAVIMSGSPSLEVQDFALSFETGVAATIALEEFNLEQVERIVIARAMDRHQGNISQAASELGLTRASLYRRIQKYGL